MVNTNFIGSISKAWHTWPLFPWKTFTWFPVTTLGFFICYWPHISNFNPKFYSKLQIHMSRLPTQYLTLMSYSNTSLTCLKLNSPPSPTPSCFLLVFQISINGNSILLLYQKSYGHLWLSSFSHSMSYPSAIPADFKNTVHINHFSLSPHPTISCLYYFNSLLTSLQNSTPDPLVCSPSTGWHISFKTQATSCPYSGIHLLQHQVLSPNHGLRGSIQSDFINCSSLGSPFFRYNAFLTSPRTL